MRVAVVVLLFYRLIHHESRCSFRSGVCAVCLGSPYIGQPKM